VNTFLNILILKPNYLVRKLMSFINELNKEQQDAVKSVEGPVMIVAGAGSGKTRVLTYRVAYLISIGVPTYQILVLTFTNKAADEMKKRIVSLVGDKSSQLWMGTFHSMFARLLRQECVALGFSRNFTIYDTEDSLNLVKNIQHTLNINTQQFKPKAVYSKISSAKNKLIYPDEFESNARDLFTQEAARVYLEYQKLLKQNNAMDFDDLLLKPIELFEKHPKTLSKYQDRFRFLLVDEYQDTNRAQYKLIKMIAQQYKNICVVGDDAQSIYRFRGAEIQNILDFEKDFSDSKVFRLEQNYRSSGLILSAAGQVIKNNINRIEKNLWTENALGDPITVTVCADERDEGRKIVDSIKTEIGERKLDFKNVAVLYRTNAQSRSIEDAFRKYGIPYVIVGGVEFYKRREIKDILGYLKLLVNPHDNISFLRVVNYPSRGIGDVTIHQLETFAKKNNLSFLKTAIKSADIPELSPKTAERLLHFALMMKKYQTLMQNLSASELSRTLVEEIGILREFKEEGTVESLARWENVQELLSAITEFCTDKEGATLESFLQEVTLVSQIDKWDDTHNVVTLMTLHSAKGLEFDIVFISGLEEGLFPIYNSILDSAELEEERRLFYVGMTRAKKKLFLSYATTRNRFGEPAFSTPSRFIKEVDSSLICNKEDKYLESNRTQITSVSRIYSPVPKKKKIQTEESYFNQKFPDYENESQIPAQLNVGNFVQHSIFGRGKILHLSGSGANVKVEVDFDNIGRKYLLLKYASLRLLRK
jgi:DNA helicase-2/ATP-dependent DNA helicase PcrA